MLAALLMCFASAFLVTPRMAFYNGRMVAATPSLSQDPSDRAAFGRAQGVSRQMLVLRMLLALGLAAGVGFLPKSKEA